MLPRRKAELRRKRLGALAVALGIWYLRFRKGSSRRWWVRPIFQRRKKFGDYENLIQEMRLGDRDMFFNYTRMDVQQFDQLLELVGPALKKNSYRESILPGARLALTLRHLAAGDSIPTLSFAYRVGKSTVCCIINETCEVIWEKIHSIVLKEPCEKEWKRICLGFEKTWNLPNCVGALDGKHVVIRAPKHSGSLYFNYKKTFSIVLFAVCDADYCFSYVDIGAYGSQSDGGVLKSSSFGHKLNNNHLLVPTNKPLPKTNVNMPHYFVGDEAFPLQTNLMRPYGGKNLTREERIYNYRISRARRCIENAFGIMVARLRIFHTTIFKDPDNVDKLIKCAVCIHNYIMMNDTKKNYVPPNFSDTEADGIVIPGEWQKEVPHDCALRNVSELKRRIGCGNFTGTAFEYREYLKNYLNTTGAIPWQDNAI